MNDHRGNRCLLTAVWVGGRLDMVRMNDAERMVEGATKEVQRDTEQEGELQCRARMEVWLEELVDKEVEIVTNVPVYNHVLLNV